MTLKNYQAIVPEEGVDRKDVKVEVTEVTTTRTIRQIEEAIVGTDQQITQLNEIKAELQTELATVTAEVDRAQPA